MDVLTNKIDKKLFVTGKTHDGYAATSRTRNMGMFHNKYEYEPTRVPSVDGHEMWVHFTTNMNMSP